MLREVVDSARALTGARYGIITTIDERGEVRDFVTSGFTPETPSRFAAWPDGPRLFAHFRDLDAPLRVDALSAYVQALGFSSDLMLSDTFLGTPMRHRGEYVGLFFLAGKEGGAGFTAEDEEVLVLFASQAATAIANARTYRDERRARADLEALVETSPVGVAVFDAENGPTGVGQPRGAADRRGAERARRRARECAGGGDLPSRRWARGVLGRVPDCAVAP